MDPDAPKWPFPRQPLDRHAFGELVEVFVGQGLVVLPHQGYRVLTCIQTLAQSQGDHLLEPLKLDGNIQKPGLHEGMKSGNELFLGEIEIIIMLHQPEIRWLGGPFPT